MTSPRPAAPSSSSMGGATVSPAVAPRAPYSSGPRGGYSQGSTGGARQYSSSERRTSEYQPRSTTDWNLEPPVKIIDGPGGRILCVADVRGDIEMLNRLAYQNRAQAIIHTGDFGFYESGSFQRISDRTLRHLVQYSTIITPSVKSQLLTADVPGARAPGAPASIPPPTTPCTEMRSQILAHPESPLLTQFPRLLAGSLRLQVPVYTTYGACEDVRVLEKLRTKDYSIPNLHILDEATTAVIEVGGVRIRLFGLGGAVVLHKLFDVGEGEATIAGGQGTMWTTLLQIGELVSTAQKVYDPTETRILITHASPGREGILMQLALVLKADLTISAGLHFRYAVSYNEFSVQSDREQFRKKLLQAQQSFTDVWDNVQQQVETSIDERMKPYLSLGLEVTSRVPSVSTATGAINEDPAWKNTWNWNLPDAAYGHMVLDVQDGKIGTEMSSVGFNFAYRRAAPPLIPAIAPVPTPAAPVAVVAPNGTKAISPIVSAATATATPTGPSRGALPSGPPRGPPQQNAPYSPSTARPPKSPRNQHRAQSSVPSLQQQPPLPTQAKSVQSAAIANNTSTSPRPPPTSKASKYSEAKESKRQPNENVTTTTSSPAVASKSSETSSPGPVHTGVTASASNTSIKSHNGKPKSNRKKSTSGLSSKSEAEKSTEEGDQKGASRGKSIDGAVKNGGDEDDKDGQRSGFSGRGGRGGRGGGRGRGAGRGGHRGGHGSSQDAKPCPVKTGDSAASIAKGTPLPKASTEG